MIEQGKYEEILESGLLLDHFLLLCDIHSGVLPLPHKRIQGFINLLTKKGYLDEEVKLTDKAHELICDCEIVKPVESNGKDEWIQNLYKVCQDKIEELTGKKQVRDKVRNKSYAFLPNSVDFTKRLKKVISLYKLTNKAAIEKTMLRHIEKCNNENNWFPIMQYYIFKDSQSQLVTDLGSIDEETDEGYKSTQKFL